MAYSWISHTFFIYALCVLSASCLAENQICKDGTMCRNGSTCIPLERGYTAPTNKNKGGIRFYRCDCSKIESVSRFYAGYECEYVSTQICLLGALAGTGNSFCTNGGECKHVYQPDDEDNEPVHDGCECPDEFEGEFCEYIKGEAPTRSNTSGLVIGLIATFATLTAVSGIFIIRKLRTKSPKSIETAGGTVGGDGDVKIHHVDTEMT